MRRGSAFPVEMLGSSPSMTVLKKSGD